MNGVYSVERFLVKGRDRLRLLEEQLSQGLKDPDSPQPPGDDENNGVDGPTELFAQFVRHGHGPSSASRQAGLGNDRNRKANTKSQAPR